MERLLDEAGSIFYASWWIGNTDARQIACDEAAGMLATTNLVPLTSLFDSRMERDHAGFSFYLLLPQEHIHEA